MDRPSNPTMLLGDDATEQVPIDAIVQLFGQDCFTVSDLGQVGLPLIFVSPSFEGVTGYEPEEAIGRDLGFLQRDDTEQQGNQLLRESIAQGAPCTVILRNYRADGTLFWNEQQHYPLKSVSGRVTHLVTVQRDVTERINALMSLEVGETLAARIQSDGRWFGYSYLIKEDDEVSMVWASKACASITGYPGSHLLDAGLAVALHPDDRDAFAARSLSLRDQEARTDQYRLVTRSGKVLWVEDFATRIWASAEAGVTAVHALARDITESKRTEPGLLHLTHFDTLTGLPNRHLLDDRIQQGLFQARRIDRELAVALVDLDNFGFVNETIGRREGDQVIKEVARRLRRSVRRTDTVARLKEDTFAILLPDLSSPLEILPVLDKLYQALGEDYLEGTVTMNLSASVGVALHTAEARTVSDLLSFAGQALQAAKAKGKNTFRFFQDDLNEAMHGRRSFQRELRRALDRDELVLHYQPRVNLQTGEITSVEALIRWVHPERGLLKPGEFLPVAEAGHMSGRIFAWVLDHACRQASLWRVSGQRRRVAVNVSAQALARDDFVEVVKRALARHDLHPALLEIELTEGTPMDAIKDAIPQLQLLRNLGVLVSLDDFGVAYASLAQLRHLPIDSLKIDRSFVQALGTDGDHDELAMLSSMITLGKSLNLTIVAEGVETQQQNRALQELQCDEGQGFLYSQAVPPEYVGASAPN